jgi:hypothetical protein
MSSVRAAVGHFEAEVSKAFRNRSVPLAGPAMTTLVANVRTEAIDLVPRSAHTYEHRTRHTASDTHTHRTCKRWCEALALYG